MTWNPEEGGGAGCALDVVGGLEPARVVARSCRARLRAKERGGLGTRPGRLCREALRRDRGSGTVWMIALMAVVWVVAVVAMSAGGVRAARHRAHAAADLAALAAASHATDGSVRACGVAAAIARAAHARLTRCALRARIAGVRVVVASHVIAFGSVQITATARAGPVRRPAGLAARGRKPLGRLGAESSFRMLGLSPMQVHCYRRVLYATVSIRVLQGSSASPVGWHQCPSARTTKGTTP
jgi:secretion/DNA translocation related TadE-like protein